jgi:hypothetical protein
MIDSINLNVFVPHSTPKQNTQEASLSVTVTPDSDNVSSGDRSANSVIVNIATPKKEVDVTVTREQAVNKLETRSLKNTLNHAIGNPQPNSNPVKSLLITNAISNGDIDDGNVRETAGDLYSAKLTYDTAQFALNTFNENSSKTSPSPVPSSNNDSENGFVALHNQATNYYIKSTLFFSAADRVGQTIDKFS